MARGCASRGLPADLTPPPREAPPPVPRSRFCRARGGQGFQGTPDLLVRHARDGGNEGSGWRTGRGEGGGGARPGEDQGKEVLCQHAHRTPAATSHVALLLLSGRLCVPGPQPGRGDLKGGAEKGAVALPRRRLPPRLPPLDHRLQAQGPPPRPCRVHPVPQLASHRRPLARSPLLHLPQARHLLRRPQGSPAPAPPAPRRRARGT
mmetsp:Transcript_21052/g.47407  ORF Transcript_21052/g.47407 Transcript_21052/m.47407 type:complete len:206 (+) Transcript_21052:807-1424(+)